MSWKVKKVLFSRLILAVSLPTIFVVYYCSTGLQGDKSLKIDSAKGFHELHISRRPQLFLNLADLFWRKNGLNLPLPYGIDGSEKLLAKVLATLGSHRHSIDNVKTCVVIGNSFSIKNRSLGSIINSYDAVIRLNNAPVRGYEADVGSKTTMRLFYPESAVTDPRLQNEPGTLMVLVPFKPLDLLWLQAVLNKEKMVTKGFWKRPPQTWLGDASKIRVLDPYFIYQTAKKLLGIPVDPKAVKGGAVHPSTGILAVFVALNHCREVHIAGFGYPSNKNQNKPIHYFGNDTMKAMKRSGHDLQHEAETLKHLEDLCAIFRLHPY